VKATIPIRRSKKENRKKRSKLRAVSACLHYSAKKKRIGRDSEQAGENVGDRKSENGEVNWIHS